MEMKSKVVKSTQEKGKTGTAITVNPSPNSPTRNFWGGGNSKTSMKTNSGCSNCGQ